MWRLWRMSSPSSTLAKDSWRLAFPWRMALTSEPTRTIPHSILCVMKYSCKARRLLMRGSKLARLSFADIGGDLMPDGRAGEGTSFRREPAKAACVGNVGRTPLLDTPGG